MEKALVKIGGKEYELRFTIGFWKRAKEFNVDNRNIEARLQEDFGTVATQINEASIVGSMRPTLEEIEEDLDRSVIDVFEKAIINSMTKAERELLDLANQKRAKTISDMRDCIEGSTEKK